MQKSLSDFNTSLTNIINQHFKDDLKIRTMFENCFSNTYDTTLRPQEDGTTFVITGDIPAMWLRDSAAQVRPYLLLAENSEYMSDLIHGVIQKQLKYIIHDPYANAFNETANGQRYHDDKTEMTPLMWERKYEIDSLCYPIQLAYLLWKATNRTDHFNSTFEQATKAIIETWKIEQYHTKKSSYYFSRDSCPAQDTLSHDGKGAPVGYTGMTWSGFRPSDDACQYGYLIPSNMFAVVVLKYIAEIATEVLDDTVLAQVAIQLAEEIDQGIQRYGKVEHPKFGTIYAYETDGLGNHLLMDDANVPSLLSIPYLGYCDADDPIYLNTRKFILSDSNPYYYSGEVASGVGSPHTPEDFIWHIALSIQGLTATSSNEKAAILETFKRTDAKTNLMHEGFHVDNPDIFTRSWFAWANSMFSEFVLAQCGQYVKGSPLAK
ncbi:glycoside hydrolase family 125 protein [Paraliobacillus salinarum]|uniref:glycoside hydrolase family 125 protein n=1 Tax=Paraliobacillus salinarum TaxID=1158996 RepID=UPI0015F69E9A|nr:glycoside hydrolase family 125 protein [Paraliobacillus salinarum]